MEGEGVPTKQSIGVCVWNKIVEAYSWMKAKLNSLFKLFTESITKALLCLRSFVTSCCEKLREMLSGNNTKLDDLSEKKLVIEGFPEEGSLLDEMRKLERFVGLVDPFLEVGSSLEMKFDCPKLKMFLDLAEGLI